MLYLLKKHAIENIGRYHKISNRIFNVFYFFHIHVPNYWGNDKKSLHFQGRIAMFSCGICKSSFSTHEELEKHTLERHNHVCSICGEAFNVKRDLAKHRMVQHKDEVWNSSIKR